MKYSNLFGKSTKTAPREAAVPSYELLYRGGFIRQAVSGFYSFLPLGMKVWEKIRIIIEEEMDKIGCQRLVVPTLHPIEYWKKTNRDTAFGGEMFITEDHTGNVFAIGATAEGMMVELVKKFSPSYKDLPILIYQFSSKFRDEKRPRGGLLRVKEFVMKDAYSFCRSEEQALEVYEKFYDSYLRIADRLDLDPIPVEAESGAIGGDYNHEFIVSAENGGSTIFVCDNCDYAASEDRAEFKREELTPNEEEKPFEIIEQPEWVKTMEDNVKHYGEPLYRYLKNVVYKIPEGGLVIASVRGDQEVNEAKLKRVLGVDSLEPANDSDLAQIGTKPGYVHSWGVGGVTYVGDLGLTKVTNFIGGQKEEETDSVNVNYGRDFEYEILADIVVAQEGKPCVRCGEGKLVEEKGIEWGHCFKQDLFYTEPHEGYFVYKDGKEKPMWMGAYGIGIGRSMAAIVETHHDEKGIIWPESVAPFQVHLLNLNMEDPKVTKKAEEVYERLKNKGVDVLYDDREQSAGEKFADADLIGIPWRVVVSSKSLEEGGLELKKRNSDDLRIVGFKQLTKFVLDSE